MPSESGIYRITCRPNGRIYVGSSKNIKGRWSAHISELRKGKHSSGFLQRAWDKYGRDAFLFETIEVIGIHLLVEREQFWIDKLQACKRSHGFNLAPTAYSLRGHVHTAESRKRMSASKIGLKYRPRSPEHLEALSHALKGKKASPETRALLSSIRKGRKMPPRRPEHAAGDRGARRQGDGACDSSVDRRDRWPAAGESGRPAGGVERGSGIGAAQSTAQAG